MSNMTEEQVASLDLLSYEKGFGYVAAWPIEGEVVLDGSFTAEALQKIVDLMRPKD